MAESSAVARVHTKAPRSRKKLGQSCDAFRLSVCSASEQHLIRCTVALGLALFLRPRGDTERGLLTAPVPERGVSGVPAREHLVDRHFAIPCSAPKISLWCGELL